MAGRNRKPGRRTADGRLAKKARPVRAKEMTDVATSQPHRSWLKEAARKDQRAECALGRLFLAGKISEPECWAGERFRSLLRQYQMVLDTPVTASSAAIMVAQGMEVPAEADYLAAERPESDEERRDRVLGQFDAAADVLQHLEGGRGVMREVEDLLMHEAVPAVLGGVRSGLQALASFWRIEEPPEDPEQREVRVRGRRFGDKPEWPHAERQVDVVTVYK